MTGKTLLQVIESRASREPGRIAFTFFKDPPCSFGRLWQEIDRCAGALLERGIKPGQPVILVLPNSSSFFYAYYGIQRAGGVAVPLFPGSGPGRIIKLAGFCDASIILTSGKLLLPGKIAALKDRAGIAGKKVLLIDEIEPDLGGVSFPEVSPGDISFIQFTSGSSGDPKGVPLSHAHLVTNMEQMIAGLEITGNDRFVSWLPLYHDMGLILMTMVPFYLGLPLDLLPTGLNYFKTWLRTIQEHRSTFTAAPDFAYRLCLVFSRQEERYDLSSLRAALNAAEPVRAGTISRFEERFGIKDVLLPAYGLAEATVGVSGWRPGRPVKVDDRGFVSVGAPFPGIRVKIMGEKGPAPPGQTGEIWVGSEANVDEYFRNTGASRELVPEPGFIRTGDLGYLDDAGDLFVVGRSKNIIIQGGNNIAAAEIEELMDEFPFVRRSAAVGIDRGGVEGEKTHVFIEVNLDKSLAHDEDLLTDKTVEIVRGFENTFGFRPGRVYLVKPGAIPRTYNGKTMYPKLKELYLDGTLRKENRLLFPPY